MKGEIMVDLHTHTIFSDGSLTPTELLKYAKKIGLSAIAVTDHDNISGLKEAEDAAKILGIELVKGVEISVEVDGCDVHLLGLLVDDTNKDLLNLIKQSDQYREERNQKMIDNMLANNMKINRTNLIGSDEKSVTRGHIAQELIKNGYAVDMQDAFDRYFAKGKVGYAEHEKVSPEAVVQAVHSAGGVVIIAHPNQIDKQSWPHAKEICQHLISIGIDGVETVYPQYDDVWKERTQKLVKENGLLESGGSDFHGDLKQGLYLGVGYNNIQIPDSFLEKMKYRLNNI